MSVEHDAPAQGRLRPRTGQSEPETAWHALTVEQVAERWRTDPARGLTSAEAAARREQYGSNQLVSAPGRSLWQMFFTQFRSLVVLLLVAAMVIAFLMRDIPEAIAILVVLLINAVIGFLTEWRAEQALSALQQQVVPTAHVIREGEEHQIAAAELVPGDLIVIAAGDRIPADGRLVEAVRLQIEEAALTGESHARTKTADAMTDVAAPLADRTNMVFLGTTVSDGRGRLLVTATGMRTEVGHIGTLIETAGTRETPLERKLDQLGRTLVGIVLVLCAVIVTLGWLRGNRLLYMLEVGISLAIAAVPEGLPAVATMTLAIGMQRMARMRAIIRRLPAVETLGSTTVICTDKTGTLTRNEMTVQTYLLDGRRINVTGVGYTPQGSFEADGQTIDPERDEVLRLALTIGALCNDAIVERTAEGETILGDPTEAALIVAAEKAGWQRGSLSEQFPRVAEVPFTSDSKHMTTIHRRREGGHVVYVKGSPGTLLEICGSRWTANEPRPLTEQDRQRVLDDNTQLAEQALRVLGFAYRTLPETYADDDLHRDLIFVGLVGMMDPLRDEAKEAIETCRTAGIRTVMITGDQPATAAEIARQLGIDRDPHGAPRRVVHARELAELNDEGWKKAIPEAAVFARVSPHHKLRIVDVLQQHGDIVAMTGDGVNDAPALKKADIGVAMGIKGTEVAKEAAAMIITDDNFATIVRAVEQGRVIYSNILRFLHYLFSCNLGEILTVFTAILVGWPLPMGPLQILWLNMVTDVLPALALALEPSSPGIMQRPPRNPRESLLNPRFLWMITWQGVLLAAVSLGAFWLGLRWHGDDPERVPHAITMAFMTLALGQVFHTFNARSPSRSIFSARLFTNAWLWGAVIVCAALQLAAVYVGPLQRLLGTTALAIEDWDTIVIGSLLPVVVVELAKLIGRTFAGRRASSPRGLIENQIR